MSPESYVDTIRLLTAVHQNIEKLPEFGEPYSPEEHGLVAAGVGHLAFVLHRLVEELGERGLLDEPETKQDKKATIASNHHRPTRKAGCFECNGTDAIWFAPNAQAVAARHHDETGHATWCDVTLHVRYGDDTQEKGA